MADTKLQIVIDAKNNARRDLKGVNSQLGKIGKSLKTVALVGATAFIATGAGVLKLANDAGELEGSMAKFKAVFKEGTDDMLVWVDTMRKEMPSARGDIIRMAADLQDLMVPMGLARDKSQDMAKGFIDVANKIGAFNDVDPTQVLESIRSGLVGSSEPLLKFGVDARVTALEAKALEIGLLKTGESFASLEPQIKNQIQAQTLLAQITDQNADAIAGFAENNDSYIRRQQELKATFKDFRQELGTFLLPMIDGVLKKILPVIESFSEWANKLPPISDVFQQIKDKVTGLFDETNIVWQFIKGFFIPLFESMKETVIDSWNMIMEAIEPIKPQLKLIAIIFGVVLLGAIMAVIYIIAKLLEVIIKTIAGAIKCVSGFIDFFTKAFDMGFAVIFGLIDLFSGNWERASENFKNAIQIAIDYSKGILSGFVNHFIKGINKIIEGMNSIPGVDIGKVGKFKFGGRAVGGSVTAGVPYTVGERGVETFIPATSGRIESNKTTNNETSNIFNFDFSGAVIGDKESLIEDIKTAINREQELNQLGAI